MLIVLSDKGSVITLLIADRLSPTAKIFSYASIAKPK